AGQLWNTVDERFMDPKYLPVRWSNPVNPLYRLPRPLNERALRRDLDRVTTNIERVCPIPERLEGWCDVLCSPHFPSDHLKAELAGSGLSLAHLQRSLGAYIAQDRQPAQTGDNLAQKPDPLAGEVSQLV